MSGRKPPSQPGCTWVEDCIEMCAGRSVYVEAAHAFACGARAEGPDLAPGQVGLQKT